MIQAPVIPGCRSNYDYALSALLSLYRPLFLLLDLTLSLTLYVDLFLSLYLPLFLLLDLTLRLTLYVD